MGFTQGNKDDGKHYWLTPPELMASLNTEFRFDFDPCPYPKPDNFDGLKIEWGASNYVNPPFGSYMAEDGKKKGPTAWARKCIEEYKKGKRVVFVYPIDKWVLMMLEAGAQVRNLKDVKWHSIEDNIPGKGTGRHVACFILDPLSMSEKLVDLSCMVCGKEFMGPEPVTCCSGRECGCMGQPSEPVVCSQECYDKL